MRMIPIIIRTSVIPHAGVKPRPIMEATLPPLAARRNKCDPRLRSLAPCRWGRASARPLRGQGFADVADHGPRRIFEAAAEHLEAQVFAERKWVQRGRAHTIAERIRLIVVGAADAVTRFVNDGGFGFLIVWHMVSAK